MKVRGVAERVINSDKVNWSLKISYIEKNLDNAYQKVDKASKHLMNYLEKNGISKDQIIFSEHRQDRLTQMITLDKLGNTRTEFIGYKVDRTVSIVGFSDLDLIENLVKKIGSDIQRAGWPIYSNRPYFYYSKKISTIKPELLKEAAKNAFERATIVAESSGSQIGGLKAARQGAFNGFDSGGFVGGYSRDHMIGAVVTVDFSILK